MIEILGVFVIGALILLGAIGFVINGWMWFWVGIAITLVFACTEKVFKSFFEAVLFSVLIILANFSMLLFLSHEENSVVKDTDKYVTIKRCDVLNGRIIDCNEKNITKGHK